MVAEHAAGEREARAQVLMLKKLFPDAPEQKVRRRRVPEHEHVYESQRGGETVYEIAWRGGDGRQRWTTVGTDLEAALKLRDEKTKPETAKEEIGV
jgi:hypothetical protein